MSVVNVLKHVLPMPIQGKSMYVHVDEIIHFLIEHYLESLYMYMNYRKHNSMRYYQPPTLTHLHLPWSPENWRYVIYFNSILLMYHCGTYYIMAIGCA